MDSQPLARPRPPDPGEFLRYYPPHLLVGRFSCPRCGRVGSLDLLRGAVRPGCGHHWTLARLIRQYAPLDDPWPARQWERVHPLAARWWTVAPVRALIASARCPACRTWMPVDLLAAEAGCWAEGCGATWTVPALIDAAAARIMGQAPRG